MELMELVQTSGGIFGILCLTIILLSVKNNLKNCILQASIKEFTERF